MVKKILAFSGPVGDFRLFLMAQRQLLRYLKSEKEIA